MWDMEETERSASLRTEEKPSWRLSRSVEVGLGCPAEAVPAQSKVNVGCF